MINQKLRTPVSFFNRNERHEAKTDKHTCKLLKQTLVGQPPHNTKPSFELPW